jgi:hypothetical protein
MPSARPSLLARGKRYWVAQREAMNLHRRLAALFLILALCGCGQVTTGQGQAADPPYLHDSGPDMRSGNNGM